MKKPLIRLSLHLGLSAALFGVALVMMLTGLMDRYVMQVFTLAGINIIIALGLNLISGFTGQLALGHAGFMAIGAYTTAVMQMQFGLPLLPALLVAGLVSAFVGLLIGFPTLRLKGDYLAIVTLGFGEIIRVIAVNLPAITGGAAGLKDVPGFTPIARENQFWGFIWVFWMVVAVIFLVSNLIKSSHGRALISIREDETAANAMGVNVFYYKMFAFVLSAFIAGLGGGLYAPFARYLTPQPFNFIRSVEFLIIVVLGGMGSITGTVVTGFLLISLQEFLRDLQDYRLVMYSLILILMMLFRPQGLMGSREFTLANLLGRVAPGLGTWLYRPRSGPHGRAGLPEAPEAAAPTANPEGRP